MKVMEPLYLLYEDESSHGLKALGAEAVVTTTHTEGYAYESYFFSVPLFQTEVAYFKVTVVHCVAFL